MRIQFLPVKEYPNADVEISFLNDKDLGDFYIRKLREMSSGRKSLWSIVDHAIALLNRPFPGAIRSRSKRGGIMSEFSWLSRKQFTIPPLQRFWRYV